jgi:arylsulfatase A-like enzyme
MKYDRVILISIDSLGEKYKKFFSGYFTTEYQNYHTTSSWTLPSHLTMLSGLKFPSIRLQKKTKDYARYENFASHIPTISTLLRKNGFKTRAITGGGFMSKFFGWGEDWGRWEEAYDNKSEWIGDKILPKKKEFLFLHTYFIHNWFNQNKSMGEKFSKFKTKLEYGEKIDLKEYDKFVKEAKRIYERRIKLISKKLRWIKTLPKNCLVILTSDHAELFSRPGSFHHGNFALKNEEIYNVPLLIRENIDRKIIIKEYFFDFLIPKLIFDKLSLQFESIPKILIKENLELRDELNRIYQSKAWKMLKILHLI